MKKWGIGLAGLFVFVCAMASPAEADEVFLKNGDRLSGDLIKMDGEFIIIKTSYGGDIKINWKEVQGVNSTGLQTFQLKDGSVLRGRISSTAPNQVTVTNETFGSTKFMAISDITAINPPPLVTTEGSLNFAGAVTKGNSETKAIFGSAFYTLRADQHQFGIEGKYNYGEQAKKISVRNALLELKYDYFITKHVYANLFSLFEQDTFQDLNLRSSFGGGPGYQFIDTPRTKLSAEMGLAFVNEDWRTREDRNTLAGRWAANFNTHLVPDRLIFFHRHEAYYDFKAPNGIRVRADQGFKVPVYKQFALNLEYDVRWNSEPAPGRKSTDHTYIFGISYLIPR